LLLIGCILAFITCKQSTALQTPKSKLNNFVKDPPSPFSVAGVYAIAPAVPAIVLPILTDTFRATQNSSDLLTVLVAKRAFLYLLATLATAYAGWRAATSVPAGEALDGLNREILRGEPPLTESKQESSTSMEAADEADEKTDDDEPIFAVLDEMENVYQNIAFALPFFLAVALSASYIISQGVVSPGDSTTAVANVDVLALISKFSTFSNLAVCLLFSAAEYRSFMNSDETNKEEAAEFPKNILTIPNISAAIAVAGASLLPLSQAWPLQNSINIALAVTVTRALAPFLMEESGSIRTIALALTGLATYDVVSVFGTSLVSIQAAGALDIDVASMSDSVTDFVSSATSQGAGIDTSTMLTADASVMETVARSKLEGPWRPGLLEMVLVGRVSDVIGLGDVVFPACLVSWGYTFKTAYAYAAIAGYILGSLLTELASTFGPVQGLPSGNTER
jgi:hypothetical protein